MLSRRASAPVSLPLPSEAEAPRGRSTSMPLPARHFVLGTPLREVDASLARAVFGMGCFWGAERKFWQLEGVTATAVGYAGGHTPNPTYEEVCEGRTGHTEVVWVAFDDSVLSYEALLRTFWENHDPTQGMRQGNDIGTQYRSAIYAVDEAQLHAAERSKLAFEERLRCAGFGAVTTEIRAGAHVYFAEEYHQQYLGKNPSGYCGLGGTGVRCDADPRP